MQKKQTVQFAVFGIVMALIHFIQCLFRIKAHDVLLTLSASQSRTDSPLWVQFSNYGKYTEIAFYTIGIIFMIVIGYRLIYAKIRFRFALAATVASYLLPAAVGTVMHFQAKGVSNLMVPVFASFFFALLIIISAGVKRNQYQKLPSSQK